MGYYKYLKKAFLKPSEEQKELQRQRLIGIRKEPVTKRLERPTRPDRARALGYRAKQGILVVRQRVPKGSFVRADIKSGRRPSRFHQKKNLHKNYQQIAEEKVSRRYLNCEVLGSYLAVEDGKHSWYEVIVVDRRHPQVIHDKKLLGIAAQKGRAFRGMTSAGRKGRGLRSKGKGAEKVRPSRKSRGH